MGINKIPFKTNFILRDMKKLTKEEKKKIIFGSIIIGLSTGLVFSLCRNDKLRKENTRLEKNNTTLKTENRDLRGMNKKLSKENYELCYHLGKKSISHPRPRRLKITKIK